MKVLVCIDVIECQPRGTVSFELRLDLRCELSMGRSAREYIQSETYHVPAEVPGFVDEIRQALRGQHGPALHQHQMQADPQSWQPTGARDRILGGGTSDHKAGGG
jgi:hypothetical protein